MLRHKEFSPLAAIREQIELTKFKSEAIAKYFDVWPISSSPIGSYDCDFSLLLHPHTTIQEMVDAMRDNGKKVIALDLMSYGAALDSLDGLYEGLSVGLTERGRNYLQQKRTSFVAGDLVNPRTWIQIKDWIQQVRPSEPQFDLIMCRPVRGFSDTGNDSPHPYRYMMKSIYNLLSENDGVFLTQIPELFVPPTHLKAKIERWEKLTGHIGRHGRIMNSFKRWAQQTYGTSGLTLEIAKSIDEEFVMKLIKQSGAPTKLPI